MTTSTHAVTGAVPLAHEGDRPLVNYTIVRWHLLAGGFSLLISMAAGFLYSLQFIGYYPFPDSELLAPGHLRLIHTNFAAYGWLVNGFTAVMYYAVPRLTGYRVWSDVVAKLIFFAWSAVLFFSFTRLPLQPGAADRVG